MTERHRYELVLAIYLTRRGLAFVLFEGSSSPVDWGSRRRDGSEKNSYCLKVARGLFHRYRPDVVVLQDTSWTGTVRSQRILNLNVAIFEAAEQQALPVCAFSRDQVRAAFSHLSSPTKDAIAEAIAKNIPALKPYLPPRRKRWQDEDARMGIFDAAALALTFFERAVGGEDHHCIP
jgi:hypothetical protein